MKNLKMEDLEELESTINIEIDPNCIKKVLKKEDKFYAYLPYFGDGKLFKISEKLANQFIDEKELMIVYLKWSDLNIDKDDSYSSNSFEIYTKNPMDDVYFGQ